MTNPGFAPDVYCSTNPHSPSEDQQSASIEKQVVKTEREIQREDALSQLGYVGRLEEEGERYHCIRVWAARKGSVKYYDCDCGRRKAVPNLSKIKRHVQIHDLEQQKCELCGKQFKHILAVMVFVLNSFLIICSSMLTKGFTMATKV
jgi:hypothetical protein